MILAAASGFGSAPMEGLGRGIVHPVINGGRPGWRSPWPEQRGLAAADQGAERDVGLCAMARVHALDVRRVKTG